MTAAVATPHQPADPRVDEGADLLARAERAARRREYDTDPAVVALAVDEARVVIERTMWVGIVLGMVFTTASVQEWGAQGAPAWTIGWIAAWLLAPLVEVPLLAILRGEQVAARYGVRPGAWVRRARWTLLTAAYAMNTWAPWAAVFESGGATGWAKVLLHSIPPLAVLIAAEALTDLRDMLTGAIRAAAAAPRPERTPQPARPATPRPPAPRRPTPRPPVAAEPVAPAVAQPAEPPAEQAAAPTGEPTGTAREVAVAWALAHWDDPDRDGPLRPLHVREHMASINREISKGEASKVMAAARAARFRDGLPTGPRPVEDDTSEEAVG